MATSSKLEMSLDEIIKANKQKEAKVGGVGKKFGGGGVRKGPEAFKKRVVGGTQQKQFGRKRIGQMEKGNKFGAPKRRVIGVVRRKPMGGGRRVGGIGPRKNFVLRNRNNSSAVMSAAENLVKRLVKKALIQQNAPKAGGIRGKFQRVKLATGANVLLTKISPRSRVIGRRPRILAANFQQQQPTVLVQRVRGRGPVRFATTSAPAAVMQTAVVTPRRRNINALRRFNTVRYLQQQQQQPTAVVLQQQQPVRQRFIQVQPHQQQQAGSVREHINALRRASTLQQLQAQFVAQSQQPQAFVPRQQFVPTTMRGPRRRQPRQQHIIIQQQQQLPFQFRQPPQQQQQQFRRRRQPPMQQQQFVVRQQFARRPRQQRAQQQIVVDPSYVPPNYLQRI